MKKIMGQFEAFLGPISKTFMLLNETLFKHYELKIKAQILKCQGTLRH